MSQSSLGIKLCKADEGFGGRDREDAHMDTLAENHTTGVVTRVSSVLDGTDRFVKRGRCDNVGDAEVDKNHKWCHFDVIGL